MFERLIAHIEGQIATLDSPGHVESLAGALSGFFAQEAPVGEFTPSGTLVSNLTEVGSTRKEGTTWVSGVGNMDKMGRPEDTAPRGTIAEFLRDFPEFKGGYGRWQGSKFAWKMLSEEAKAQLHAGRASGLYGGAPGRAPYTYVQSGDKPMWAASGTSVGIMPQMFISIGLERWREFVGMYLEALWRTA